MTEKDAAIAYAKAWNRLDPTEFLSLLANHARYASQYVFEELLGKDAISAYLVGKMQAVKGSGITSKVYAELGRTRSGVDGRDCTFLCQGAKEEIQAAILFEVENGEVVRYDLIVPELMNVERTGVFPI